MAVDTGRTRGSAFSPRSRHARTSAGTRGAPAAPGAVGAGRAGGSAEPVGALEERLRERLLQRGGPLDERELAQLPVRLGGPEWPDDGGQAAAVAVGAGAVGAGVRLSPAEHPGAPGVDGRGERGAAVRPGAPPFWPPRRLRGRAGADADADHGGDFAPQQPGRAAGAVLRGGAVVWGAGAGGRAHALARARGRVRGAGL